MEERERIGGKWGGEVERERGKRGEGMEEC